MRENLEETINHVLFLDWDVNKSKNIIFSSVTRNILDFNLICDVFVLKSNATKVKEKELHVC